MPRTVRRFKGGMMILRRFSAAIMVAILSWTIADNSAIAKCNSPLEHGAVADDLLDDTEAIQVAVDRAGTSDVCLPAGEFVITRPIDLQNGVTIRGVGIGRTVLVSLASDESPILQAVGAKDPVRNITIKGLSIMSVGDRPNGSAAIRLHNADNVEIRDVAIDSERGQHYHGIVIESSRMVRVTEVLAHGLQGKGISLGDDSSEGIYTSMYQEFNGSEPTALVDTASALPKLKLDLEPLAIRASAGQVTFYTGASSQSGDNDLFWDNTNKRLGIGTTTPGYGLDAEKAVSLTYGKFGATKPIYFVMSSVDTVLGWNVYYNSSWKFGKGSSSSYGGAINVSTDTGNMKFFTTDSGNADAAATMTERLRIEQGGDVGIGTTNPTQKLEVNGTVKATALQVSDTTVVTNLNADNLDGYTWAPAPLQDNVMDDLTLTTTDTEVSGGSFTIDRTGYWLIVAIAQVEFIGSGDNGQEVCVAIGATSPVGVAHCVKGNSGDLHNVTIVEKYSTSNGGVFKIYARKLGGTGTSKIRGLGSTLAAFWIAPS